MSVERTYDPTQRDQVINTLRSEILAARLKVTLDKKRNKDSSALVKKLAALKLPSLVEPQQAKPPAPRASSAWHETISLALRPSDGLDPIPASYVQYENHEVPVTGVFLVAAEETRGDAPEVSMQGSRIRQE